VHGREEMNEERNLNVLELHNLGHFVDNSESFIPSIQRNDFFVLNVDSELTRERRPVFSNETVHFEPLHRSKECERRFNK
jgi:hypothetical protein